MRVGTTMAIAEAAMRANLEGRPGTARKPRPEAKNR